MRICQNERFSIKSKVWIECQGKPLFGEGRVELLRQIDSLGSINQAALALNMSYRRAWSYIKFMEERLGVNLVERRTGGPHGGGASLTPEALDFMNKYEELTSGVAELVDEKFRRIFAVNQNT